MSEAPAASQTRRLRSVAIVLITCFTGWLVMQLEILGARLLTPYFGSNIYVTMGSVIGVFLLSLSVGYMLGGWISGSRNSKRVLGILLSAAGVWLCTVPLFSDRVCDGLFDLGDKLGSLVAALILFGPPTVLLGTVSPTAIRWLTTRTGEAGLKAGIVLGFSVLVFFSDSATMAVLYRRLLTPVTYREFLPIRGVS